MIFNIYFDFFPVLLSSSASDNELIVLTSLFFWSICDFVNSFFPLVKHFQSIYFLRLATNIHHAVLSGVSSIKQTETWKKIERKYRCAYDFRSELLFIGITCDSCRQHWYLHKNCNYKYILWAKACARKKKKNKNETRPKIVSEEIMLLFFLLALG